MYSAQQIADALDEMAALLELAGESVFKIRAYQGAAEVVRQHAEDLAGFVEKAGSKQVKGIGDSLGQKIVSLFRTGIFPELHDLRSRYPPHVLTLRRIPGLGLSKIRVLFEELQIADLQQLENACLRGKLAALKGFGAKSQQNILDGINRLKGYEGQCLFSEALAAAERTRKELQESGVCQRVEVAGAVRRRSEIVSEITIIAEVPRPAVLEKFAASKYSAVERRADDSWSIGFRLENGLSVRLIAADQASFPAVWLYHTGNEGHIAELAAAAQRSGLVLLPVGLSSSGELLHFDGEEDLYRKLGLNFIPPELREGRGELSLYGVDSPPAPKLVQVEDLKGIIHAHSTYSDGKNTLREMALGARERGFEYLGISDHSASAMYANGLSVERVRRQRAEIDGLNDEFSPFRIFHGIECEIAADGSLDYPEKVLRQFDFVISSVHSQFKMSKKEMTRRVCRAICQPATSILGHPTGRLILERDGYELDMDEVMETAAREKVAIELNSNPHRLDIDWRVLGRAKQLGLHIPICPDAHAVTGFDHARLGVFFARKGALTIEDIPNCWPVDRISAFFGRRNLRGSLA